MEENISCKLVHPFRMVCSGPSMSGKTTSINYIIENLEKTVRVNTGTKKIDRIIVCYSVYQDVYGNWPKKARGCLFFQDLPNERELVHELNRELNNLLFIDDLDHINDELVAKLFTVYSHHTNTSVIFCQHSIFNQKNHNSVLISRNSDYIMLMPNFRDLSGVRALGYQIKPSDSLFLLKSFESMLDHNGKFLLCDFRPGTPKKLRFRESIDDCQPIIYYTKKYEEKEEK